jgi:hypothetical protein
LVYASKLGRRVLEDTKRSAHRTEVALTITSQRHAPRVAIEESRTEGIFQIPDLETDGAVGNTELCSCFLETQMPCRRFEGTNRIQRGNAVIHG